MTGQVHWLPFVILIVAISPVFVFWLYGRFASKRYVVEKTTVRCPAHDNQILDVTLVRDAKTGTAIGIRKCSAHNPDDTVRCDKSCLPRFVQLKPAAPGVPGSSTPRSAS
jgi:hypothetical protein